ncbi:uncharacterized protein Z520_02447 [Fonsecaea multimorphosa CBS 102226]|uniref:Zn(2)-C6 fungal-type domain-containing protein n=1 Tax=Fonsecaea multimorphosa CBS 102226 TaxID=1442371 RepID=A0A0D2KZZ0_9EURO|nr:uncharacterized protein Z520_02447 [Fonsecaea multimorphosa CBS 102226]KIY02309.1 hypothetical protein Z520_02447 [Fonsecaea multimorphosa CBS 102226]OAL28955.1 hypothetical protein AYO22_02391 [Fonsecaea multimorphosa]
MSPKESIPRKKSCNHCYKSKVRCDLKRPSCTRCSNRNLDCTYVDAKLAEEVAASQSSPATVDGTWLSDSLAPETINNELLDFGNIHLVCTVDEHRIRGRWLESLLPSVDQRPKPFQASTMAFVTRVFKSYPRMFLTENHPPFIHWSQIADRVAEPLANCMNITRMWVAQTPESAAMVREVIGQEMSRLFQKAGLRWGEQRAFSGHLELLAILQCYLLYTIMLFCSANAASLVEQDIMIKLQDLAGDLASRGTLCPAETTGSRPDWESWIVASTKRRTLFATYLLDNLVNFTVGSPSFVAVELTGLPAPASKPLWNARDRRSWNAAYNQQLGLSSDGELLINDLWPQSDPNPAPVRQKKIDDWLSSVDEFGMMLYAVTSHTYNEA